VLEHIVIHSVEGGEQDKDGKNNFSNQEVKAILRFGAEKLFKESGPTSDNGLVSSCMNGGNSTGAPWPVTYGRCKGRGMPGSGG
jgi:hypothetical protein